MQAALPDQCRQGRPAAFAQGRQRRIVRHQQDGHVVAGRSVILAEVGPATLGVAAPEEQGAAARGEILTPQQADRGGRHRHAFAIQHGLPACTIEESVLHRSP